MFRDINIKEDIILKVDLYKNRREKIAEIPLDYIESIFYKFNDIDEINITIPKYIMLRGELVTNHIYSKINTRQQIIITTISKDGSKESQRFVLHNKKTIGSKNSGSKSFTAYSWQKTIEKQRITVEQMSRQLTNKDDNVNISEGILDLICKKIGWKVGYVDPDARYKISNVVETFNIDLYENFTSGTIKEGGVIFDKQVNIPSKDGKPTYLTINYTNLKTIYNNTTISDVNILNNLSSTPFYTTITNIKAEHYSVSGNRYGIKYTFTLDIKLDNDNDKNTIEVVETFTNCLNKNISCDKIYIGYDYGDIIEIKNIQYANFEAFDDSAYKFLEDIGEVFDCIFLYDTMTNTINVYAKENLNENNGYKLGLDININEVNISENDEIITCLKVESDNTSVAEENPNGTNIIENYDYYIRNRIISNELMERLEKYNKLARERQESWLAAKNIKNVTQQRYTKAQSEAKTLEERIKNLNFRLTQFIVDSNTEKDSIIQEQIKKEQAEAKKEIDQLEIQYNNTIKQMSEYQNEINKINDMMAELSLSINKSTATDENGNKLFTDEDLQELNDMVEIDTLTDSYYTTSYGLYNYAVKYLNEKVVPTLSFDMTSENLKERIKNKLGWNNILKLGNVFTLESDEIFKEFGINEVRLIQYKLIPLENGKRFKLSDFKFSNRTNLVNTLKVGSNIGRTTNNTKGIVTTFRNLWESSKVVNNFVGDMITSGLNIAAANIKGGVYRNILDFSEAGCFIINNTNGNTDNQIYLGGGTIAITNNAWETSKVAIDSNGVIAQALVGRILLGEDLVITGDDGMFYVGLGESDVQKASNEFGIYIYDKGKVVDRIFLGLTDVTEGGTTIRKATLRLKDSQGNKVVLSEDGVVQTSQFVCWDNVSPGYPMRIPYFCDDGVKENRRIILSMVFEKYRAFEKGMTSGGKISTSSAGGGGTSAAGGGGTSAAGGGGTSAAGGSTTVSGGGTTSVASGSYSNTSTKTSAAESWINSGFSGNFVTSGDYKPYPDATGHVHLLDSTVFKHKHNVSISVNVPKHTHTIPGHSHNIGSHTHALPDHTHVIPDHTHVIPDHTHVIDTTHNHELEYGIFEQQSKCSNVNVYVNNILVNTNSPINSDVNLDITNHILESGKKYEIRIESQTNGRITCNIFTKSFNAF